jgi:large subunit ribosomal protein L19e
MALKNQKRLAAQILKSSKNRIRFDQSRLEEIKEAITKVALRGLIHDGSIYELPMNSNSKGRIRAAKTQYRKGRGKGPTRRKGKHTARQPTKREWINRIRLIRVTLSALKEKGALEIKDYRKLYMKANGGFFRSLRHLKLFMEEQGMLKQK